MLLSFQFGILEPEALWTLGPGYMAYTVRGRTDLLAINLSKPCSDTILPEKNKTAFQGVVSNYQYIKLINVD